MPSVKDVNLAQPRREETSSFKLLAASLSCSASLTAAPKVTEQPGTSDVLQSPVQKVGAAAVERAIVSTVPHRISLCR